MDPKPSDSPLKPLDPKGKPRRKKRGYLVPRILFWLAFLIPVVVFFYFFRATLKDIPPLTVIENPTPMLSSRLLAADGSVLDNFYSRENRVRVSLDEISPYVVQALIATEDHRFYDHSGIDGFSLPAIAWRYLAGTRSGASTITMQLSRNLFDQVKKDRTLNRKIKEVIVATILERKFTKEEILEAYLNTVNIFSNAYGIEMSSQRLFGKSAIDLDVEEAALMVGMLKGQGIYNPIRKPEAAQMRRNFVLWKMDQSGCLTHPYENLDSLRSLEICPIEQKKDHTKGLAPYFRQHVKRFMARWCNQHLKPDGSPYDLYKDGLVIYSTIDPRLQQYAEKAVTDHLTILQTEFNEHVKGQEPYRSDPSILDDLMRQSYRYILAKRMEKSDKEIREEFRKKVPMRIFSWQGPIDTVMSPRDSLKYYSLIMEAGVVSIDPQTGEIKAWVGGNDFKYFKYDHVAQGKRQVGSTFKPFIYATAMDNGMNPCDQILNQPVYFEDTDGEGTRWAPKNSDGKVGGLMTLKRAMATSTNLVTARLMKKLSPRVVAQYAHRMGIQSELDEVYALCLGVSDLNVLELTGSYTTFVNQGIWTEPHFITRVEDRYGHLLQEFPVTTRRGLNPKRAFMMVEMLRAVVDEGTAIRLRYKYQFQGQLGAKTGTTQNHSDGWFIGLAPKLVTGIWVGCSDRRVHFNKLELGQGAHMALPIWAGFMKQVYLDNGMDISEENEFQMPRGYISYMDCDSLRNLGDQSPFLNSKKNKPGIHPDDLEDF